jgi:spermidine synthase
MTREAFQGMRRILRPDGVLVINTFGRLSAGEDFFTSSLEQTLRAVFTSVEIHSAGNGNVFFVASPRPEMKPFQEPNFELVHDYCRSDALKAYQSKYSTDPSHGRILTDDFNPIDFYDAANREGWRRQMALSMQDL